MSLAQKPHIHSDSFLETSYNIALARASTIGHIVSNVWVPAADAASFMMDDESSLSRISLVQSRAPHPCALTSVANCSFKAFMSKWWACRCMVSSNMESGRRMRNWIYIHTYKYILQLQSYSFGKLSTNQSRVWIRFVVRIISIYFLVLPQSRSYQEPQIDCPAPNTQRMRQYATGALAQQHQRAPSNRLGLEVHRNPSRW